MEAPIIIPGVQGGAIFTSNHNAATGETPTFKAATTIIHPQHYFYNYLQC